MASSVAAEASITPDAPLDTGLFAFVLLLRFLGQPADVTQLRHQFAPDGELFTVDHLLRAAKRLGLKARCERVPTERLDRAVLPAIACLKDGSFGLLAKVAADRVLMQDLASGRPTIEQRQAFESRWAGELVLMTTRERLVGTNVVSISPGSSPRSCASEACSARRWSARCFSSFSRS
jgi:subfamily B ATP-binding cassette protein HlyB/CyaB